MLNPEQQKVVEHREGPLLVLAGPGSGKTRVLVHRIARLIESGVHPSQILAVTFTNKAAGEMRGRIEALVGPRAREVASGTFHSVCLKLLRRHAEGVGLGERFVVYDESDQLSLVKECMATLNIDRERLPPRSVVERISRAKDSCQGPREFAAASAGNPYLARIASIYERYQARLLEVGAADFGDLIRLVIKLFDEHPDVLKAHQWRWRYLLVDEYQDTNHAQYRFIKHLAEAHGNICVVGDDDQSVYRWRGADISNILSFEENFPGAAVVRLEQNYRSTKAILAAAQGVVSMNAGRKDKEIWTENPGGSKVAIVSCGTERREAEEVARRIAAACGARRRHGDIAVFYRTNAQSRPFEEAFRASGIPYRIFGGIRFYERAEVKDALAYLRLIVAPHDDIAFKRIVNSPARGIGKTTIERLQGHARESGASMLDAIGPFAASGSARGGAAKRLAEFAAMIAALREGAHERDLDDLLRDMIERSGYIEALSSMPSVEAQARLENLNELLSAAAEFKPDPGASPAAQFLDQVALVSGADDISEEGGAVAMMTLHLAKGLEFPCAFIVGMEEGLLPHSGAEGDPEELEEERRLCYVGMTRAKEELTLTHASVRRIFGKERFCVRSRFLDDIPDEHAVRISPRGDGAEAIRGAFRARARDHLHGGPLSADADFDQRSPEERAGGLGRGTRVRHPLFGVGTIAACERTGIGHRITVRFASGETKRLIAELSNLLPI